MQTKATFKSMENSSPTIPKLYFDEFTQFIPELKHYENDTSLSAYQAKVGSEVFTKDTEMVAICLSVINRAMKNAKRNNENFKDQLRQEKEKAVNRYENNMQTIYGDGVRELERTVWGFRTFFSNLLKPGKITIMNASASEIADRQQPSFFKKLSGYLLEAFNQLRLTNSPNLILTLDWLGGKDTLMKLAELATRTNAMLVTPFMKCDSEKDLLEIANKLQLQSSELSSSNVVMPSIPLVVRKAIKGVEQEPLTISAAASLAGLMVRNSLSQVSAGFKFGRIRDILGPLYSCNRVQATELRQLGLIAIGEANGSTYFWGDRSLCQTDDPNLRIYSVARLIAFCQKETADYLSQRTFENYSIGTKRSIEKDISKFFNRKLGKGWLKSYQDPIVFQDADQPEIIHVKVKVQPKYPSTYFLVNIVGKRDENEGQMVFEPK